MKMKIITKMIDGDTEHTIKTRVITKEFAIVEEKCNNGVYSVWLKTLDGNRVCPMYINDETLKKLKPGMLVTYESDYTYNDMGIYEIVNIVDIKKLEEGYFK